ncbi:3-ketoacyl-CoA synthase 4 [Perilla frutescens var. hirtella]|uniref:3-ketoacyl-CoA synthase 4 n=1 Tax=Perilla frutescens var. hirtella TaxID=608512 RepID=A0AAD4PE21_PERFH|nr:3-ketoacyl-CoA synthase 4 [Perilla frutescens var. hirtella]
MAIIIIKASQMNPDDVRQLWLHLQYNLVSVITCSAFLVFGSTVYIMTCPRPVYLVDYACYRTPDFLKAPYSRFMEHSRLTGDFDESSLEFQRKILKRSGLGDETYVPEVMHSILPQPSIQAAREEAEQGEYQEFQFGGNGVQRAGVIAVNLAKDMLQVHRNTYAVVVSTENITQNWYFGNKKSPDSH